MKESITLSENKQDKNDYLEVNSNGAINVYDKNDKLKLSFPYGSDDAARITRIMAKSILDVM